MPVLALVLQAAAEGSQQAKNPILPEANEIIWGSLAFIVLLFFMWKFAFPAVTKMMNDRTERIRANLDNAEKVKTEAQSILDDYQRQLADAKNEANRIIEEARKTADSLRKDIQAKAEQEAQNTIARAQEEIRGERDRVFQELKAQVGELSLALAGRMVGESLDRDRHLRLVDDYIRELGAMPSSSGGNGHGGSNGGEG